jgi:hypothetical protein
MSAVIPAVVAPLPYPHVAFEEGEFEDHACAICGVMPCSIRVRDTDEEIEFEEAQKTGLPEATPYRYFCAEHQTAAERLYHELA